MNPLRWFFGFDVFVTYARADTGEAAMRLEESLASLGLLAYVDQVGSNPAPALPKGLVRALRRSSVQLVLMTEAAMESKSVLDEIRIFRKTSRTVLLVSFVGDAWRQKQELQELLGGAKPNLATEAPTWFPDSELLRLTRASVGYWKRSRRAHFSAIVSIAASLIAIYFVTRAARAEHHSRVVVQAMGHATVSQQVRHTNTYLALQNAREAFRLVDLPETQSVLLNSTLDHRQVLLHRSFGKYGTSGKSLEHVGFLAGTRPRLFVLSEGQFDSLDLETATWAPPRSLPGKPMCLVTNDGQAAFAVHTPTGESNRIYVIQEEEEIEIESTPLALTALAFAGPDRLIGLAPMSGVIAWDLPSGDAKWIEEWEQGISGSQFSVARFSGRLVIAINSPPRPILHPSDDSGTSSLGVLLLWQENTGEWKSEERTLSSRPWMVSMNQREGVCEVITGDGLQSLSVAGQGASIPLKPLGWLQGIRDNVYFEFVGSRSFVAHTSSELLIGNLDSPMAIDRVGHSSGFLGDPLVACSHDGRWVAAQERGDVLKVWDLDSNSIVEGLRTTPVDVYAFASHPQSGETLIVTEKSVHSATEEGSRTHTPHASTIGVFSAVSPTPASEGSCMGNSDQVGSWQVAFVANSTDEVQVIRGGMDPGEPYLRVPYKAWGMPRPNLSPNGGLLAFCAGDLHVFDLTGAKPERLALSSMQTEVQTDSPSAFDTDGKFLAMVTGSALDRIQIWEIEKQELWGEIQESEFAQIWSLAFSPNGQEIAVGMGAGMIQLWSLGDEGLRGSPEIRRLNDPGTLILPNSGQAVLGLSFDAVGRTLLAGGAGPIYSVNTDPSDWLAIADRLLATED